MVVVVCRLKTELPVAMIASINVSMEFVTRLVVIINWIRMQSSTNAVFAMETITLAWTSMAASDRRILQKLENIANHHIITM